MKEYTRIAFSGTWTDALEKEIKERSTEPFSIRFGCNGSDYKAFAYAINQGIDSHLEAVQFVQNGNEFIISAGTLHVLVRRMMNAPEEMWENSYSFASGICEVLHIELV